MTLRLTVVDQTPIHENRTAVTAPAASEELAIECEKLGYHRYWVAEHHNSIQFAGAAPEVLVTRIASDTSRMRIGRSLGALPENAHTERVEFDATLDIAALMQRETASIHAEDQ